MRKVYTLFLLLAVRVGTMFAWDYEHIQIGDLYYNLDVALQTAEVTYQENTPQDNYPGLTEAVIPSSVTYNDAIYNVTSIGGWAFANCEALTSLIIDKSVTNVGTFVIYRSAGLTSVEAPAVFFDALKETYWPNYTDKLSRVVVCGGELTENALRFITRSYKTLESLDVSAITNTELADEAFRGYYNLTELKLPQGLTSINYMTVADCKSLREIAIPAAVTEIGASAFENCRSLSAVQFAGEDVTRIGNWAFYNCHVLQNIEIPEGLTEIGDGAFYGCTYLNNLSIPASVRSIGDNAFALCSKLGRMDVDAMLPPVVEDKTFYEVSTEAPVYVPDESIDTYKSHVVWGRLNIVGKSQAPTGIDNVQSDRVQSTKVIRNGQILILRGEKVYTVTGQEVR